MELSDIKLVGQNKRAYGKQVLRQRGCSICLISKALNENQVSDPMAAWALIHHGICCHLTSHTYQANSSIGIAILAEMWCLAVASLKESIAR